MNRQAWIVWLMILLQATMFWHFAETLVFPVVVVAISLPAMWRSRWIISSGYLPWIDLALAIFCALKWDLAPYDPPGLNTFLNYPLVYSAGQFFLLVQVTRLWARRPDHPLPIYLPLLAVLVFVCLGDVSLNHDSRLRRLYQHATLALIGLSCLYYSAARRRQDRPSTNVRWVRLSMSLSVLVVCGLTARAGNSWVLEKWSAIEQLMMRATGQRRPPERRNLFIGFSGQAPLGSVQLLRSSLNEDIALRVVSERSPGYLRGAVFERYTPHGWEWHSDWVPFTHTRLPLPSGDQSERPANADVPGQSLFLLRPNLSSDLRPVTIWRTSAMERFSFLPLATSRLEAPADLLYVDRHSVVAAENLPSGTSLIAWVPEQAGVNRLEPIVQPPGWEPGMPLELTRLETVMAKVRLRQLPNRMDPRVIQLASRLFANCQTPLDKIEAVRRYFATYSYAESIQVPPRVDPVTYFLLEKPPAHCEFFASATAVLLRLAGIPCRYVTGYAGAEYNPIGRYWIVRQRDAHAWVEAHVPGQGWIVVDSTPSGFVPHTVESFSLWMLWDDISLRGQMIRTALAKDGMVGKLLAAKLILLTLLTTIPGWMLTGGTLFLIVRKVRFVRHVAHAVRLESSVIELRRLLEELDRRLRRFNLERATHETLHQFAERLRTGAVTRPNLRDAAEWYLRYAASRYGMPADPEVQASLRAELQTVCDRLSERRATMLPSRIASQ